MITNFGTPETFSTAVCAQTDPEAFFPGKGGSAREARSFCQTCDCQLACLNYAISNREMHGCWGGVSGKTLKRIVRAGTLLTELPDIVR